MKKKRRTLTLFVLVLLTLVAQRSMAHTVLTVSETKSGFALYDKGKVATIYVDAGEPVAVRKAVSLFADDVERVKSFAHPQFAGVDLNSRFEIEPGLKDVEALRQFIQAIRN